MGTATTRSKDKKRAKEKRAKCRVQVQISFDAGDPARVAEEVAEFVKLLRRHSSRGLLTKEAAGKEIKEIRGRAKRGRRASRTGSGKANESKTDSDIVSPQALPQARRFLRGLVEKQILTEGESRILLGANVRSARSLMALLRAFPSLSKHLDFGRITDGLSRLEPAAAKAAKAAHDRIKREELQPIFGARPQRNADVADRPVRISLQTLNTNPRLVHSDKMDVRSEAWPVRDQGQRGSCVSFAMTACLEQRSPTAPLDLSEQFHYWSMKSSADDPWPGEEGGSIAFGLDCLKKKGICTEELWPYVGHKIPGNISHDGPGQPSGGALKDAATRLGPDGQYGAPPKGSPGTAQRIYDLLKQGIAVAVTLPVFEDVNGADGLTNWTTDESWDFGLVLDPSDYAAPMVESGHAVCLVGYVENPNALGGGWFLCRNSWGEDFGYLLEPNPEPELYVAPARGYGQISAHFIENYTWEWWHV